MKKSNFLRGFSYASLVLAALTFASCSDDDKGPDSKSELEDKYFSIENATYTESAMPEATSASTIDGLTINNQALSGGMNLITIISQETYRKFFLGVEGIEGHYIYTPQTSDEMSGYHFYTIPVMYSTNYNKDITMAVSAETAEGKITKTTKAPITFVESKTGALDIKLVFSNAKDIDLHLIMPSGREIYYGNRGGSVTLTDGSEISYGLDHDSNASCYIDNLNNENIYIPAELIENGTYTVKVNMYSNCDSSIPTSWSIVARYKGELIRNESGHNPASGVYPIGAGEGDHTEVMTFTITDGTIDLNNDRSTSHIKSTKTIKPSEMDLLKIDNDLFDQGF